MKRVIVLVLLVCVYFCINDSSQQEEHLNSDITIGDVVTSENVNAVMEENNERIFSANGISVTATNSWHKHKMNDMSLALAKNEDILFMVYESEAGEVYFEEMIRFLQNAHADYVTNTFSTEDWISFYLADDHGRDKNLLWLMSEYWCRDYVTYRDLEELFSYGQAVKTPTLDGTIDFFETSIGDVTIFDKKAYVFIGKYHDSSYEENVVLVKACVLRNGKAYNMLSYGFSDVFNVSEAVAMLESVTTDSESNEEYDLDAKINL